MPHFGALGVGLAGGTPGAYLGWSICFELRMSDPEEVEEKTLDVRTKSPTGGEGKSTVKKRRDGALKGSPTFKERLDISEEKLNRPKYWREERVLLRT